MLRLNVDDNKQPDIELPMIEDESPVPIVTTIASSSSTKVPHGRTGMVYKGTERECLQPLHLNSKYQNDRYVVKVASRNALESELDTSKYVHENTLGRLKQLERYIILPEPDDLCETVKPLDGESDKKSGIYSKYGGRSLAEWMHSSSDLTDSLADIAETHIMRPLYLVWVLYQTHIALTLLHGISVSHSDLKPANIVVKPGDLTSENTLPYVRLIDFGESKTGVAGDIHATNDYYGQFYMLITKIANAIQRQLEKQTLAPFEQKHAVKWARIRVLLLNILKRMLGNYQLLNAQDYTGKAKWFHSIKSVFTRIFSKRVFSINRVKRPVFDRDGGGYF
jgi:serine/threonine protein kinase